jgi:cell fate regulator YaaT (PSP1 superfamily)
MTTQGIRFDNGPKLYAFENPLLEISVDARVVVQSRRGLEVATVRTKDNSPQAVTAGRIERIATPEDLAEHAKLEVEANDLKWFLRAKARERRLNVKIILVEITLDGTNLTVSYSSEERIELRGLVQDLNTKTSAQIHFHAVGARDQARIMGVLGVCGTENCSSHHLQEFTPVTIRMSRDQQLPLNPEKISGPCGRLLCCLQYEHDMYIELLKDLPRKGAKVCSHNDSSLVGKVVKLNPLKGTVDVRTDEGQYFEARGEELKAVR